MEPLRIDAVAAPASGAVGKGVLLINGAETVDVIRVENGKYEIFVTSRAAMELLQAYSFRTLDQYFTHIHLDAAMEPGISLPSWVALYVDVETQNVGSSLDVRPLPRMQFQLTFDLMKWERPWTTLEYSAALIEAFARRNVAGLTLLSWDGIPDLGFRAAAVSQDADMGEEIRRWEEILHSFHDEATAQLVASQHADSLITTFHFPPAIATACEQYLLYFVQFLADLDIKAEAEVQHKAAEVLFRVTPADGSKPLERIREALDAYLRLPTDPSFAVVAAEEQDLAVRQLEANVFHLQGQLAIAKAVLQAKDAAIEALELSNYRLRQIGGGEILSGPLPGSEDSEAIISGVVSVKEVEKGGFVLHTPEILRKLKRRFGGTTEG